MNCAIVYSSVIALSFAAVACGGNQSSSDASGGAAGTAAGGSGATGPGCTSAPNCGSCQSCYDQCVCESGDSAACVDQCASTGGAGGSGGQAGGGAGGSTNPTTVTIKTSPRALKPGEEAFFCQNFANPFGGDVDVLQSESFMTPGSHHMFVFYEPGAQDGPVQDCSGLEYKRTLHTAQTPQQLTVYPPDVGRHVPGTTGLRVLAHYLNTGSAPLDAEITVTFKVVPGGTVKYQAGSLFFLNTNIYVPPAQTGQATDTCTLPYDIQLIDVVNHMHQYSTNFSAKTGSGKVVYQGTDWEEPQPTVFDPPLQIPQGETITYTCDYKNTTSQALVFGESAVANEMCILSGTYYPAPGGITLPCN